MSAYKAKLLELWPERLVRVDRKDAESIQGAIQKVEDTGVSVKERKCGEGEGEGHDDAEGVVTFIAFEDIRGVADLGWDMEAIS